jgi:8-oxo-dGTP pyrophosphatase MutT (NUDIX family)
MIYSGNLTPESISDRLAQFEYSKTKFESNTTSAGVVVPFLYHNGEWYLLFTQRTNHVKNHKGQVSFPGGMAEPQDKYIFDTAIREAREEIGLFKENFRIFGLMQGMKSLSGYYIYPVVGQIIEPFVYTLEKQEVESVFTVPIRWLSNPAHWVEKDYQRENGSTEKVIFYQEYDNHIIWGITARITIDLLQILNLI